MTERKIVKNSFTHSCISGNMGKLFAALTLVLFFFQVQAQNYVVSGRVLDAETRTALPFVNIVAGNSQTGTSSDIDGKFEIVSSQPVRFLRLSYVGYQPLIFDLPDKRTRLEIFMQRASIELEEVQIVAGENPAHRIIKNVIENRDANDPEKLASFAYTSYDKMVFTSDTLDVEEEKIDPNDSSFIRIKKFLSEKDFFMMETVAERKFMAPDRNKEKVLASRISGFKDPVLLFLSSQLQSTTFYHDMIHIADKDYVNPISRGSLTKYYFQIEDTSYTSRGDSVFIISYRPRKNTNFDGLQGVLSINNYGWAIQNVIAEPWREEEGIGVKIQQMYALVDDSIWFPVQLNTDILFNNMRVNQLVPVGRGKSYISSITLNPELVKRQFNQVSIEFDPNAGDRSEDFWLAYRGDSLSRRERKTYAFMDSIGQEANLDKQVGTLKSLINMRLPLGKIDLDLSKIARYNEFEGFYLGLGLLTSPKLSQRFGAGAYWGYGFKDQTAKYGGNVTVTLDRYREIKLHLNYFKDASETGGVQYFGQNKSLVSPDGFRDFLIKNMDQTERLQFSLSFRALRYGNFNVGLNRDMKQVTNSYYFAPENILPPDEKPVYGFATLSVGFRYAYKEKFLEMPDTRISLGTGYPVLWFQYSRGINGFMDGEYEYNRFDLKITKTFVFKYLGKSTMQLMAGYVDNPIPQSNLYNGHGSYRSFTIYAPASFATQRMNEFLADRYAFLFYTHDFGSLLWRSPIFSPEFAVATNVGFGWLNHPEYHQGVDFKIMDQSYLESGLLINKLLNIGGFYTLGVGVFYRYGYYHLPKVADNFAWKINISFPFAGN